MSGYNPLLLLYKNYIAGLFHPSSYYQDSLPGQEKKALQKSVKLHKEFEISPSTNTPTILTNDVICYHIICFCILIIAEMLSFVNLACCTKYIWIKLDDEF